MALMVALVAPMIVAGVIRDLRAQRRERLTGNHRKAFDEALEWGALYSDSFDIEEGEVRNYVSLYFEWP